MTVEQLREAGVQVEEGLARCMNNEAFYLRMVGLGLADERFGTLGAALESGSTQEAFEMAHALKGVLANLALTPVQQPVSRMTEILRGREEGDCKALWQEALTERQKLLDLG
ncbi:MAG: Hpt domain-containing protein [Lachnospiraceae bacterium]|nr:Hpt domain-containing protein [Lachnospiraceae bacterium]